ncbi:pentapeptide repeat-containing protein, partial [Nostoc piscinale]|uniref:pentapeptide repeat-containing protein n=1 Tax=Nostoc piscinale TaxID=224012 RepID=UPI0039A50794
MNQIVKKTVVEIDLFEYSDMVENLQQNWGLKYVPTLNEEIQSFIDDSLKEIGNSKYRVYDKKGDNRVIFFDDANDAFKFAEIVHRKTKLHNVSTNTKFAKRLFRIGAATGEFVMNYDGEGLTGYSIITAYRLEANAEAGKCFIVDVETYNSFSPEIQEKFGDKEIVFGKKRTTVSDENVCDEKQEEFQAHRCKIIYDDLLECFEKLNYQAKQIVYQIGLEDTQEQDISKDNLISILVKEELIIKKENSCQRIFVLTEKFLNYFPEIIINVFLEEIKEKRLNILKDYSIVKILERLNLESLKERLQTLIQRDGLTLADYLINIIKNLQKEENDGNFPENYAVGNILNLLIKLDIKKNFSYFDLSNISIWNADLTEAILTGVDFRDSDLKNSKFSQPLGCIHSIAFNADGSYFATGDAHGSIRVHNT